MNLGTSTRYLVPRSLGAVLVSNKTNKSRKGEPTIILGMKVRDGDETFEGPATITVTIEVVLDEIPTPTEEEQTQQDLNPEEEAGEDEVPSSSRKQYKLPLPFFRFRFIEGSCVETPTVLTEEGATNETWEEILTDNAGASGTDADEQTNGSSSGNDDASTLKENDRDQEAGEGESGDQADESQPAVIQPPTRWRWTREFPIEKVDDVFLAQLNERPHIVCSLGCQKNSSSLLGFLPMDVSPLLDGDLNITKRCCSTERSAGNAPDGILEWSMTVSTNEPLLTRDQRLRLNPMSIQIHRVVRLPGIDIEETRNPRMLKAMLPTRFALLREHCHPIFTLFQMQVKRSPEAVELAKAAQETDMELGGGGADGAEGGGGREENEITTTAERTEAIKTFTRVVATLPVAQEIMSELAGPTEEELRAMEKAKKKRARQKSGGGKKGAKKGKAESSEGADLPARDKRRRDTPFEHKTVILSGLLDRVDLLDYLAKGTISVELHDRDIVDQKKEKLHLLLHERMISGAPDPEAVQAAVKRALSILSSDKKNDEEAVASATVSATESVPRSDPMDPYQVTDLLWRQKTETMLKASEINTHGVAKVRLSQLAAYTGELRGGFQRERAKEKWMTRTEKEMEERKKRRGEIDESSSKGKATSSKGRGEAEMDPALENVALGENLSTGQEVKMREVVRPTKRTTAVTDDEEQESWDYTEEQRLVRNPGAYLLSGTEVVVTATIARNPMSVLERRRRTTTVEDGTEAKQDGREGDFEATRSGANGVDFLTEAGVRGAIATKRHFTDVSQGRGRSKDKLFERAVYCFRYDDEEMLQQVQGAMYEVNQASLPEASLRSHQMTEEERQAANNGDLDVVTGFTVIDDAYRLIVVEGIGSRGMRTLHRRVERKVQNGPRCRVLADPTVTFTERLYAAFDLDLKRIRLRDQLPKICESPDIYNRAKVPLEVFEALHRLFRVRTSMRLRHVRDNQLFPTAFMLLRLESKYGEAISLVDMDGQSLIMDPNATLADDDSEDDDDDDEDVLDPRATRDADAAGAAAAAGESAKRRKKKRDAMVHFDAVPEGPKKRKADTDCWNDAFEKFLIQEKGREHPDFIGDNERMAAEIKRQVMEHRASLPPLDANLPPQVNGTIFIYSGQKLQLTELRREEMKKKLARRKNITFTYSSEFQSQTLCLVNEDDIDKDAKELSKSKYTTKSGFVYPAPKDPEEYKKHPRQLSQSRRDQLKEPWEEPGSAGIIDEPQPWEMPGVIDFDTIPDLKPKLFGGYRADGVQEDDKIFFRSVHMGGDGVEQEMHDAEKRKKQEWLDAVIVDNIHYQPHYGERGNKPSQLGKLDDILSRPPQKLGLKVVHRAKLPSGEFAVVLVYWCYIGVVLVLYWCYTSNIFIVFFPIFFPIFFHQANAFRLKKHLLPCWPTRCLLIQLILQRACDQMIPSTFMEQMQQVKRSTLLQKFIKIR